MARVHRSGRARASLLLSTALAMTAYLVIGGALPASAAGGCGTSGSTLSVTIASNATTASFTIDDNATSGDLTDDLVVVSGVDASCSSYDPDTYTTMSIVVDVAGGAESVEFVDPANAAWPATINVNLGDGVSDVLELTGTDNADTFNTSDPVDSYTGVEYINLYGEGDDDNITNINADAGVKYVDIYGGPGNDTITGSNSNPGLADPNDYSEWLGGDDGNDEIYGQGGADWLGGNAGEDQLYGGDGNDLLVGYQDDDLLDGGAGADLINAAGACPLFDCSLDSDVVVGGDGVDTVSYAPFPGVGSAGGDILRSEDLVVTLDSGTDDDGAYFAPSDPSNEGDDVMSVENVTGGTGDDVITGNAGNNTLKGGAGHDNLYGLSGNDTLEGGPGADDLSGGDLIDTATYVNAASLVVVDLSNSANNGGVGEEAGDTYADIENLTGSGYVDTLTGTSAANVISGGGGDDIINGGDGNDLLYGGDGGDTLNGQGGADTIRGGAGVDTMTGDIGNDSLFGDAGAEGSASNWMCGGGTDKVNLEKTDGFTKSSAQSSLIGGTSACERLAGSFAR